MIIQYMIYEYIYTHIYVYLIPMNIYDIVSGHLVHRECAILPPTFIFTNAFADRKFTKITIILPKIDQHYSQSYSHSIWGISSKIKRMAHSQ